MMSLTVRVEEISKTDSLAISNLTTSQNILSTVGGAERAAQSRKDCWHNRDMDSKQQSAGWMLVQTEVSSGGLHCQSCSGSTTASL